MWRKNDLAIKCLIRFRKQNINKQVSYKKLRNQNWKDSLINITKIIWRRISRRNQSIREKVIILTRIYVCTW